MGFGVEVLVSVLRFNDGVHVDRKERAGHAEVKAAIYDCACETLPEFRLLRQVSDSLPLRTYRESEGARRSNKAIPETAVGKRSLFVLMLVWLSLAAPQCWASMHPRVNKLMDWISNFSPPIGVFVVNMRAEK